MKFYICRTPVLTVVHFSAEWAEQCQQVTEVLKELVKLPEVQSSGSKIALCDAEKLSEISLQYKVKIIHTNYTLNYTLITFDPVGICK